MKLSDIAVYKYTWNSWVPRFQDKVEPSVKTKSFLFGLINDSFFLENLQRLRSKYKIPKDGFPSKLLDNYKHPKCTFDDPALNGTYDVDPLFKEMCRDVTTLVDHYQLPPEYVWIFFILISHNTFLETDPFDLIFPNITYIEGKKHISLQLKYSKDPIAAFILKGYVTKEQFKQWIDILWKEDNIGGTLKYIMPKIPVVRSTYKNVEIDETIFDLLKKEKTVEQIQTLLEAKYPDNDNVYEYSWVNNRISRIKKRLHLS